MLLPKEKVYSQVDGVLNISTQECRANVGTMIVTNIRFVSEHSLPSSYTLLLVS